MKSLWKRGGDKISPLTFLFLFYVFVTPGGGALFTDGLGRAVDIPDTPRRIVSLAPNLTEVLFALGLDDRIAGVTSFCDYPEEARHKTKIGGFIHFSLEKLVSLKPDLVLATADGNRKETVLQIERLGCPLYVVNPKSLDEILEMINLLGTITGTGEKAGALADSLRKRIDKVAAAASERKPPRVFLQVGTEGLITAGRGTFLDELIRLSGGINVAGTEGVRYPRYGMEKVVSLRPEVILVIAMDEEPLPWHFWKRWPGIPAVRSNRIHLLNADLVTRPSHRIVDGLEEMFSLIHRQENEKPPKEVEE